MRPPAVLMSVLAIVIAGGVPWRKAQHAMPDGNPFDNPFPHKNLPKHARDILWDACRLVLESPADFGEAVEWMNREFSESVLRTERARAHRRKTAETLTGIRNGSKTHARRLALHRGVRLSVLKVDRMVRAYYGGQRLKGDQVFTGLRPEGTVINLGNVDKAFQSDDAQYRREWRDVRDKRRRKKCEVGDHDHPEWIFWRLERACLSAKRTDIPSGSSAVLHARRVILLAHILAWFDPIPLASEFCKWKWETQWYEDGFDRGRETALFTLFPGNGDPCVGTTFSLDELIDLVGRAVNAVRFAHVIAAPASNRKPIVLPTPDGEWSSPMSKTAMRVRLDNMGEDAFNSFLRGQQLITINRQLFKIRLDGMDVATRRKLSGK